MLADCREVLTLTRNTTLFLRVAEVEVGHLGISTVWSVGKCILSKPLASRNVPRWRVSDSQNHQTQAKPVIQATTRRVNGMPCYSALHSIASSDGKKVCHCFSFCTIVILWTILSACLLLCYLFVNNTPPLSIFGCAYRRRNSKRSSTHLISHTTLHSQPTYTRLQNTS